MAVPSSDHADREGHSRSCRLQDHQGENIYRLNKGKVYHSNELKTKQRSVSRLLQGHPAVRRREGRSDGRLHLGQLALGREDHRRHRLHATSPGSQDQQVPWLPRPEQVHYPFDTTQINENKLNSLIMNGIVCYWKRDLVLVDRDATRMAFYNAKIPPYPNPNTQNHIQVQIWTAFAISHLSMII